MAERRLFGDGELADSGSGESQQPPLATDVGRGTLRLRVAGRDQLVMRTLSLDQMLPLDDEARTVVAFVEQCDLAELYDSIQAVEGQAGRATIDPQILLSLWLYATIKGIGSAREVDRQCRRHWAFQWICGDVSVNDHTLADFRVAHGAVRDRLLTEQVAELMSVNAVTLPRVAQDGVRVRASAGASSFRRQPTLEECLVAAQEQVTALKEEVQKDPSATSRRQQAEWRQRMGTESAQAIDKERASTAECVNALARQRGLTQFRVRGLAKVKIIATWFALAHNVLRWSDFRLHPRVANAT